MTASPLRPATHYSRTSDGTAARPWPFPPTMPDASAPNVFAAGIFLSTFAMIGQNRQVAFQQAKADHDFVEQELELKSNTELTREIHTLVVELAKRSRHTDGTHPDPGP